MYVDNATQVEGGCVAGKARRMYESRLVGVLVLILLSEVGRSNYIYTKVHVQLCDRNIEKTI